MLSKTQFGILFLLVVVLTAASTFYFVTQEQQSGPVIREPMTSIAKFGGLNTQVVKEKPQDWKNISLTDLNGNTFTINEYHGIVVVEMMAMWCPQCVRQQMELIKLAKNNPEIAIVSIDIEYGEEEYQLSNYVTTYGYSWPFVLDRDWKVGKLIMEKYGNDGVNPQATPIIIVNRAKEEFLLDSGIKDYETILEEIDAHKITN